jgi:hypothetical protein
MSDLERKGSQDWISVDERLPEPQTMVLCYMPLSYNGANGVHYGWLNMEVNYMRQPNGVAWRAHSPHAYAHRMEDEMHTGTKGSKVTHWMPLPKPPSQQNEPSNQGERP